MKEINNIIYELEMSLLKPEVRSSKEALDKLLADDFIEFGTSGNKYTKVDILERLPSNTNKVVYIVSDFSVEIPSENLAITTFKTERTMDDQDKVISQRSSHWRKTDIGWQMFFHEATPINTTSDVGRPETNA